MSALYSLDTFKPGQQVRIEQLGDCPKARCRLCALGLTPGAVASIRSNGGGPCRLMIRGSDVVIGRGMARKVLGRLVNGAANKAQLTDLPDQCATCSEDL